MNKYYILAAAAIMMAACANDENESSVDNSIDGNVIRLSAQVAGANAVTRAGVAIQSTAFAASELINVECQPNEGTLARFNYTTGNPTGNVNTLSAADATHTHYWPANGATVTLKAFYPSTVTSETTTFSVSTNQAAEGSALGENDADRGYKGSDLMYSATISNQSKTTSTLGFTFNHALTKIVVKLTPGDGMTTEDIAAAAITLHAKKTATISNGAVTAATDDAAVDINMGVGSDATNGIAAIIVPQTIAAESNFITVASGGHSVIYKLAAEKTFAAGSVYTYSLKVGMAGITLESTTITNWTDGGEVDATGNPLEI